MSRVLKPILTSSQVIKRYDNNPILSKKDMPYSSDLIFNAGVAKYNGQYVMLFRNDYNYNFITKGFKTNIGVAFSTDGVNWNVRNKPFLTAEEVRNDEVRRIYDPRISVIGGKCYICFAMDTKHGIRGGIASTEDFNNFNIISLSVPDNRNMVLFPDLINNMYVRLERPCPVYGRGGRDRFDIWLSKSYDLKFWGESSLLLGVEDVPYANDKIGPGAPPIKTEKGYLTLFHAVDIDFKRRKNGWENKWKKRYTAGIMLLDLEQPNKIIGMSKQPLIAPETDYETRDGFRNHVIFPGGLILEDSGEVKIYYGASDTVECLATANVDDLLKLCLDKK